MIRSGVKQVGGSGGAVGRGRGLSMCGNGAVQMCPPASDFGSAQDVLDRSAIQNASSPAPITPSSSNGIAQISTDRALCEDNLCRVVSGGVGVLDRCVCALL